MKFKTQPDFTLINGTSMQGAMQISYFSLVDLFGEPLAGDGYKTDAEWVIQFEDGTVATIYNWKNGFNYMGVEDGLPVHAIQEWHIGGKARRAYDLVVEHCKDHLIGTSSSIY